jgi:hypothetical protein
LNGLAIAFVGDVNIGNGPEGHGYVEGRWEYPSSFRWRMLGRERSEGAQDRIS